MLVLKAGKGTLPLGGRKIQIKAAKTAGEACLKFDGRESLVAGLLLEGKRIDYYAADEPLPHLLLFGWQEIYFVNPESQAAAPVAQFNRLSPAPGQFIKIFRGEFATVIIYEAGVCAVSASGRCLWQTPLETSDKFLKVTPEILFYKNEEFGTEFKIDLMDGRVFCE